MNPKARRRFDAMRGASLKWDPELGGKRSWLCFEDSLTADLGADTHPAFEAISERMLDGRYYPPDAIQYFCDAVDEGRRLRPGDRVLQRAPLFPFLPTIGVWSMVEIFVAEQTEFSCHLGYVTTKRHHGRGIWQAILSRQEGRLSLKVTSTTSPQSWMYWIGLPLARFLQLRARRRAIEEFRKVAT